MTTHLSPATQLGYVHYTVANLKQQIEFYTEVVGLKLHWHKEESAGLGVGADDLIQFTENKIATRYPESTGLYHQALLLPNRKELARIIARLYALRYPNSPTDHTISQTTYLDDPEGNTIELLADTPNEGTWEVTENSAIIRDKNGQLRGPSEPLDLDSLFSLLQKGDNIFQPLPDQTLTGHVHLYVTNLDKAMHFYSDILRFEKQNYMTTFQMADVTLPAHNVHMIAFNTWKGTTAQQPPADALGMQYFTINLTSKTDFDLIVQTAKENNLSVIAKDNNAKITDPFGNKVCLTV